jgi:uncharacterized protein
MLVLLIGSITTVWGITFPEKPPSTDYFVDKAFLLKPETEKIINETAGALLSQESIPLFVVTIKSLSAQEASGQGIEGYAQKLFDHWGIGYEKRNYGMLLLVSVGDRKARIELGKDWAHDYDSQANDVMQSLIVPAFKRGDYSTGISDGVRGMDAMARGLQLPKPTAPWWFWPAVIIGGIGLVMLIINLFRTGRSGWAWALIIGIGMLLFFILRNMPSGSSGGFGGGSSGGGGATGSW